MLWKALSTRSANISCSKVDTLFPLYTCIEENDIYTRDLDCEELKNN